MTRFSIRAGTTSLAFAALVTLFGAYGSGAAAQEDPNHPVAPPLMTLPVQPGFTSEALPGAPDHSAQLPGYDAAAAAHSAVDTAPASAASLADLVAAQPVADTVSPELKCLAGAIYFEARSETLAGQLAVGRVIVNRAKSGRFPGSYCGVVTQPSQFSFVHGGSIPTVDRASHLWRNAVAIAEIADGNGWQSEAEGALYFHATRVSPSWHMKRVAQIDNHVFYR